MTIEKIPAGGLGGLRNYIINGGFDIWQRGTAKVSSGYIADRWAASNTGMAITGAGQHREALAPGTLPGKSAYHYSVEGTPPATPAATDYLSLTQFIEDVRSVQGTVTVTFWAKANSAKPIGVEVFQGFGSGGSTTVTGVGQSISLTTSWQKFSLTFTLPSTSGKTIGDNSWVALRFWLAAGSNYTTRAGFTASHGGTFDIANVTLVEGPDPVDYAQVARPIGEELALCQRYYCEMPVTITATNGTGLATSTVEYPVTLRAVPTITFTPALSGYNIITNRSSEKGWALSLSGGGADNAGNITSYTLTADAEL